jgi:hypothetical protein
MVKPEVVARRIVKAYIAKAVKLSEEILVKGDSTSASREIALLIQLNPEKLKMLFNSEASTDNLIEALHLLTSTGVDNPSKAEVLLVAQVYSLVYRLVKEGKYNMIKSLFTDSTGGRAVKTKVSA